MTWSNATPSATAGATGATLSASSAARAGSISTGAVLKLARRIETAPRGVMHVSDKYFAVISIDLVRQGSRPGAGSEACVKAKFRIIGCPRRQFGFQVPYGHRLELSLTQVGQSEPRALVSDDVPQPCPIQVGPLQLCPAQVGPLQLRLAQVGPLQLCPGQVGPLQSVPPR